MIEKLEDYPFLGEEEEIMTWKDGIRKERTNECWRGWKTNVGEDERVWNDY